MSESENKPISSKLNNMQVVIGLIISLVTAGVGVLIGSGNGILPYLIQDTIEVVDCKYTTEEHVVEMLERYEVEIEPSDKMAKVSLQGYIEIIYEGKRQVVLLEELFIQRTYISEDGRFPILKRDTDKALCEVLRNRIETKLNVEDSSNIIVNADVLMCFAYSEEFNISYYLLNNAHPKKIHDDDEAREKVSSKVGEYIVDITCYEEEDIAEIVDKIVEKLE